jgi:RadC-like JAB domain
VTSRRISRLSRQRLWVSLKPFRILRMAGVRPTECDRLRRFSSTSGEMPVTLYRRNRDAKCFGDLRVIQPSKEASIDDATRAWLEVTTRLVAAGEILGIPVLDHIVVGDGRYFSFKEAGRV